MSDIDEIPPPPVCSICGGSVDDMPQLNPDVWSDIAPGVVDDPVLHEICCDTKCGCGWLCRACAEARLGRPIADDDIDTGSHCENNRLLKENQRLAVELARVTQERDEARKYRGSYFDKWVDADRDKEIALARVAAERDEAFARGRTVGREDVGKYSNAIGLIESAVGIAGAKPLAETVRAVQALVVQRDVALAAAERIRGVAEAFKQAVDGAIKANAARGRGGQHVSYHGDFASATPSVLNTLQWWLSEFERAATSGGDEGSK